MTNSPRSRNLPSGRTEFPDEDQVRNPATKTNYHRENLRGELLAVARAELESMGLNDLSLRSIARLAGVSSAAPAYHFSNKEGLLVELATEGFAELMRSRLAAVEKLSSPAERARQMLRSYVNFALGSPKVFDLMFGLRIFDRRRHPALQEKATASFRIFLETISEFAASSGWEPDSYVSVTHVAWAMEHGLATLFLSGNAPSKVAPIDTDKVIEMGIELFLQSVRHGKGSSA